VKQVAKIMTLMLGFTLALSTFGCQGSKVVVGTHPHYEVTKLGPPPWAPAHGYRAKYRYPALFVSDWKGRSILRFRLWSMGLDPR
jgi:hypothetical protein